MILSVVLLLLISTSLGSDEEFCSDSSEREEECGTIFYPIVKPLLRYFEICQQKDVKSSHWHDKYTEALEKYSDLQTTHSSLQTKYSDLQTKYSNLHDELQAKWSEKFAELQASNKKKDLQIDGLKSQVNQLNNQIDFLQKTSELEKLTSQVSKDIEKDSNNFKTRTQLPDRCPNSQKYRMVIQEIQLPGSDPFKVSCYSDVNEGSGWMLVAQKKSYSNVFNRTHEEFKNGFHHSNQDSFIGLERLHMITSRRPHQIMYFEEYINSDDSYFMKCDHFILGNENEGYNLKEIDGCTGDTYLLDEGAKFSSFDRNFEGMLGRNFAKEHAIGWWFNYRYRRGDIFDFKTRLMHMFIRRKD